MMGVAGMKGTHGGAGVAQFMARGLIHEHFPLIRGARIFYHKGTKIRARLLSYGLFTKRSAAWRAAGP
jgi:hypothetical protein